MHRNISSLQRGQGMVEYIIIVALVALSAIAAFSYFGGAVRGQTVQMTQQVAGSNDTSGRDFANQSAIDAQAENVESKLGDYDTRDDN